MSAFSLSSVTDQVSANNTAPTFNLSGITQNQSSFGNNSKKGGAAGGGQSGIAISVSDLGAIEYAFEFAEKGLNMLLGEQAAAREANIGALSDLSGSAKELARSGVDWQKVIMWGAVLAGGFFIFKAVKK